MASGRGGGRNHWKDQSKRVIGTRKDLAVSPSTDPMDVLAGAGYEIAAQTYYLRQNRGTHESNSRAGYSAAVRSAMTTQYVSHCRSLSPPGVSSARTVLAPAYLQPGRTP
eukprot:scaffold27982_cov31-Tisochrysis_lutea.AAC.2